MESSSGICKFDRLTGDNFDSWKQKVQWVLSYTKLEACIDPKHTIPADPEGGAAYSRKYRKAMAVIGLSLSDAHRCYVNYATGASAMWRSLLDIYERHTLLNQLTARRKLYTAKMSSEDTILTDKNRIRHFRTTLYSMELQIDD